MTSYIAYADGPSPRRSVDGSANEALRLCPRGVRMELVPVALGGKSLEDLPDFALRWLERHGLIRRSKRDADAWTKIKAMQRVLAGIKERNR